MRLKGARHPCVERFLERSAAALASTGGRADWDNSSIFVPNDVVLSCNFGRRSCQVVTGPNMGGKSSYVRMIAVIAIMGQIGSHVPADFAQLTVFENIFTRMGAGDDLASGTSTFMAELYRTSLIIQKATRRSLVILDELGRGTSTHDGVAIAKATLRYFINRIGCATLFVTHFPTVSDMIAVRDESSSELQNESQESTSCPDFSIDNFSSNDATANSSVRLPLSVRAVNIHMGYIETDSEENIVDNETNSVSGSNQKNITFLYKAVDGKIFSFSSSNLLKLLILFISISFILFCHCCSGLFGCTRGCRRLIWLECSQVGWIR